MTKVSFVIPAYDEENYIRRCLDAIRNDIAGRDGYEIIVVDNNSTDGTTGIVAREYPDVTLLREPRRGANRARETGFAASTGAFVAFLDADTEIPKGWSDRALVAFAKDPKLVCLSGPFIYYDLPFFARLFVTFFYAGTYLVYLINNFILRTTSMIQGGTEIVRREALQKIGGHAVNITFYGDDADLARRLRTVGKVRWSYAFAIRSSGRRLAKEGAFTMGLRYAMNYFWITMFNRPFTMTSTEARFAGDAAPYRPASRTREIVIAVTALIVLFALIAAIIYVFSFARI